MPNFEADCGHSGDTPIEAGFKFSAQPVDSRDDAPIALKPIDLQDDTPPKSLIPLLHPPV